MDPELKHILDEIDAKLRTLTEAQALAAKPILTTAEATALANCGSESAFYRWATTWGVVNSGAGRWPRQRIEAGLYKEARSLARKRGDADRRAA